MNNQETKKNAPEAGSYQTGLDEWNNRLDQNMETEESGNSAADERAKAYSEEKGSGDQSDDQQ
jgi:hypothetical protein